MFEKMNERLKKMTVMDIGLVKWSSFFFAIIIVKLFPQLLKIDYIVLVVLVIACGAKPLYFASSFRGEGSATHRRLV